MQSHLHHFIKYNASLIVGILIGFVLLLLGAGFLGFGYITYHGPSADGKMMADHLAFYIMYSGLFGVACLLLVMYLRGAFYVRGLKSVVNDYKAQAESELILSEKIAKILETTNQNHAAFLDMIGCGVFILDENGRILDMNKAAKDMIPSGQDYHAVPFSSLAHYEDHDKITAKIQGIDQLKSYQTPMRLKANDGGFKNVQITLLVTEDASKHIVASVIDYDDHTHVRQTLKNTELNYRYIVENSGFGFFEIYPDGTPRTIDITLAKLLGYQSEETCLAAIDNIYRVLFIHDSDRRNIYEMLVRDGHVLGYECQIKSENTDAIWVGISMFSVNSRDGDVEYYKGHFENIDKRKHVELALHQAKEDSDLANRSKSQFLANMSHELRTPLNAILGFSDLMRTTLAKDDDNDQKYGSYVQDIHDSGKHLLKIINEILDIAKIDIGQHHLSEEEINLSETVQAMCDLKQDRIVSRLITLDIKCDEGLTLIADNKNVKQIILNLLSNAIQFTPEKGLITIHGFQNEKNEVALSITDTGPGMSNIEIKQALEPFGAVNASDNTHHNVDIGYGLTLTKELMKAHGGTFDLISQRGMGTTATVIFPSYRSAPV